MNFYQFFIYSFILNLISSEILKFPFKSRFNIQHLNKDNIMQALINNDIFTQISFGSNNQIIEMNIKLQKDSTFILSDACPENTLAKKFNQKNSDTYEILLLNKEYYMYDFKEATYSKENIILLLDNDKKIQVNDYKFMLANSLWKDVEKNMGGEIGLILTNKDDIPKNTDFITQLKQKNIIDSYVFMLDYKDKYNGILYIGNYFHEFNKNFSDDDFIMTKAGNPNSNYKSWNIIIDKIITNNYLVKNNTYMQLYYEMGIIASPDYYHDYIKTNFFKNYLNIGICQENLNYEEITIFNKYHYIICDKKNFKLELFPDLIFYNKEMNFNFSLNYKDLFYEFENKIYFLIIFPVYSLTVEYWFVGKPFFLKYKLFLDKDKKIIGLYENYNDNCEEIKIIILKKDNIIEIIIIVLLIIVLLGVLYYFLVIKKSRKIKASELEEKFNYIPMVKENKILTN